MDDHVQERGVHLQGAVVLDEAELAEFVHEVIDPRPRRSPDLRSVKAFTDAWEGPLDILVNNAGIMAVPQLEKTPQSNSVRHQFPGTLRAHDRFAQGTCCGKPRPSRIGKPYRPFVLAGDFR